MSDLSNGFKINALKKTIKRLNNADVFINKLANNLKTLNKVLEDNIKINDISVFKNYAEDSLNEVKNISMDINGVIIPSINKRIEILEKN